MKTYRVEVVEIETGKVVAVIGRHLNERQAERRVLTGLDRFDPNRVFVRDVEEKPKNGEVRHIQGAIAF